MGKDTFVAGVETVTIFLYSLRLMDTESLTLKQSVDVIHTFIFEMIHHPEVAKKAQAEIDEIIGDTQLPSLKDRASLPYIDRILKEVFRCGLSIDLRLF